MLDIRLLGKFQVSLDGQPIEISSRPTQSLLAYLILNAGTTYRREQLAGILWPDSDEQSGRHNLRQTLWRLGKAIGKEYLQTDKITIGFNHRADYTLDTAVLQQEIDEAASADQLIDVVSVYDDVLLPGFYDDWVSLERERLQAVHEDRLQLLLDRLIAEKRWRETRDWAESWIAGGQVPEAAYRALMLAHAALGDQAGVTSAYRRCVQALEEEIGVEPSPETQALYERLSAGQDMPELKSQQLHSRPQVHLPIQPTPFIGRETELQELTAILADPANRLLTILGPGGIGKTRLAIETARTSRDAFDDGVYFVSLASLDDPELIATPIANALDLSFRQPDQFEEDRPDQQLLTYLRDKQLLLVLDNLEHLVVGPVLIAAILQKAPGVTLLSTSRERLGLRGETVYTVHSMHVPEEAGTEIANFEKAYDALQLFTTCAQRALPQFALTTDNLDDAVAICKLVGGLPLGIELAAAWIGLLTTEEIAAEIKASLDFLSTNLQDVPDHQQSMRSIFESSWNRLTPDEQSVFRGLSVFRGGFTRRAAQSVTGASLPILMALVNKSLIQPDYSGRYLIHELLRQYGREKLQVAGDFEQTKERHLLFFLQLSQESVPKLDGPEQVTWLNKLETEHDNFRAALEWARTAEGQAQSGLLLATSLRGFFGTRGYYDEGREYLLAALSRPGASQRTAVRAKALQTAGQYAYLQGDYPTTRSLIEESLSIYRELTPSYGRDLANALITLGDMETELGDYAKAAALMNEGLDIMRELGDERGIGRALWQLGACAVRPGDYDHAVFYFEEALPLLRKLGDRGHTAIALSGLAEVAIRRGDLARAAELEEESLALRRELNIPWGVGVSLGNLAWIALRQDDLPGAASFLAKSLALRREIGDRGGIAWCLEKLAEIALISGQTESASAADKTYQQAVKLFAAAEALRAPVGSTIDLIDQPEHERQVVFLRRRLDETTFMAAWAAGKSKTLNQAVDYALTLAQSKYPTQPASI
jgi:predicted ATPase/DNA-binding SARP family transcriptional activator